MTTMKREQVQNKIEKNESTILLEILPEESFQKGHLPGAKNVPLEQIDSIIHEIVPHKQSEIIVYCASELCSSSHLAAEKLMLLGYQQVFVYAGGKKDWIAAGLPLSV